jgi:hypothetical protein
MMNKSKCFVFLLVCALGGAWAGCEDVRIKQPLERTADSSGGSSSGQSTTEDDSITGHITYAHLIRTVNDANATCTTSPPSHVLTPQSIPRNNPKFCWNNFNNNVTSWSFVLKDQNLNNVPGCSTPGFPAKITPATTTIVCTVTLNAGATYYGYLSHVYNNVTYSDNHPYQAQ